MFAVEDTKPNTQYPKPTSSNSNLIILAIVIFLLLVLGLQVQIYSSFVSLGEVKKELKESLSRVRLESAKEIKKLEEELQKQKDELVLTKK